MLEAELIVERTGPLTNVVAFVENQLDYFIDAYADVLRDLRNKYACVDFVISAYTTDIFKSKNGKGIC